MPLPWPGSTIQDCLAACLRSAAAAHCGPGPGQGGACLAGGVGGRGNWRAVWVKGQMSEVRGQRSVPTRSKNGRLWKKRIGDRGKKRPTVEKNGHLWKLGLCVVSRVEQVARGFHGVSKRVDPTGTLAKRLAYPLGAVFKAPRNPSALVSERQKAFRSAKRRFGAAKGV
jgi:hypothetical protein